MGFFKSLTSQVGRDTGRVISNKVWGDKHASVYRRAQDHYKEKQQVEEQEALNRMIAQQRIEKIQNVTESNLANIISMKVPQQKEELVEMLQQLLVMLIANPWGSIFKVDCKITNKYSDAILVKYEQVIFTFKMKYPAEMDISYYEKQLDDLKKTRKKVSILKL